MTFLWGSYSISLGFLLDSCGMLMIILLDFYRVTMCFLWEFHGGSVEIPKDFKGMPMGFPLDCYGFCMVLFMIFYGVSLGFLWDFHGISIGFL